MKNIINIIIMILVVTSCQKDFYLEDLQDTQELLEQLRANNTSLTSRLSDLQSQFDALGVENSDLQSMLDRAQEEIDNLTSIEDASEEEIEVIEEIIEEIEVIVEEITVSDNFIGNFKLTDYLINNNDFENWEVIEYIITGEQAPDANGLHGYFADYTKYSNGINRGYQKYSPTYETRIAGGHLGSDITLDGDVDDFFELEFVTYDNGTSVIGREVKVWETDPNGNRIKVAHEGSHFSRRVNLPVHNFSFQVRGGEVTEDHFIELSNHTNGPGYVIKASEDLYINTADGFEKLNGRVFHTESTSRPAVYVGESTATYVNPISSFPNVEFTTEGVGFFKLSHIENLLREIEDIMGVVPEFQEMLYSNKIRYTDVGVSHSYYSKDATVIGVSHSYTKRPPIHELAHAYHEQVLENGVDNQEVINMFNMVSHDLNEQYGDENNVYWRTNKFEFFAEILTTYIYAKANEQGIDTGYPDPIGLLDSTFYNNVIEPYFDNLFN